ncbi:MAG: hypothetical protein U5K69_24745 [Balneolaceae bacterium]|nr:hypothetical protein [Balneolaceae bacterium]
MDQDIEASFVYVAINEVDVVFKTLPKVESLSLDQIYTIRYFFPDRLKAFREDNRYEDLIRQVNKDWGLNPHGSIPADYDIET